MNNNRNSQNVNSNNRRRGRGNNNRPQGGGGGGRGEQLNRIDSRARGNAPQMLEKYKKLASDAHLNGDRVQAEYYLQFADHYFRVIADQRLRQEEQRAPRPDRQDGSSEPYARQDENEGEEYGNEGDFPVYDQQNNYRRDEQREPRNEQRGDQREPRNEHREPRNDQREAREPRPPREFREQPREAQDQAPPQRPRAELNASAEPAEQGGNPFTRNENRGTRGLRPRREPRAPRNDAQDGEPMGLDPSLLPPAITESRDAVAVAAPEPAVEPAAEAPADQTEAPAPRRRGRPRKVVPDATVETVDG